MDNTTNTKSSSAYDYAQFCGYRLPCGYCTRLDRPCPMYYTNTIQPIWTLPTPITCKAEEVKE